MRVLNFTGGASVDKIHFCEFRHIMRVALRAQRQGMKSDMCVRRPLFHLHAFCVQIQRAHMVKCVGVHDIYNKSLLVYVY